MQSTKLISLYLMVLALVGLCPMQVTAEKVDHNGTQVEANGSVKDCLSCHDGAAGKMVPLCTAKCKSLQDHSVLTQYPPRNNARDYAPLSVVRAKGIKIVHGNVTCISCHDLRKQNKYFLVMENPTELCQTCHMKM